ncbi:4-hydroxy-3-methylbut-2-enyl diphosphate reductase, partial [mine drainage metagenome]
TGAALERDSNTVALGQVVHNARALQELEGRGLREVTGLVEVDSHQVVVTAHGATPELFREAAARGLEVVDTTCPLVRRVQRHAQEMNQAGLAVVVVGNARHSEVQGVVGWAGAGNGSIVEVVASVEEADRLPFRERRGVLCQSTFPQERFREIVERLRLRSGEVEVRDTSCPVVNQRHREAVAAMLDDVDVVLVVGGRGSA